MNGVDRRRILLGTPTGGLLWFIIGRARAILLAVLAGSSGPAFPIPRGSDCSWLATGARAVTPRRRQRPPAEGRR